MKSIYRVTCDTSISHSLLDKAQFFLSQDIGTTSPPSSTKGVSGIIFNRVKSRVETCIIQVKLMSYPPSDVSFYSRSEFCCKRTNIGKIFSKIVRISSTFVAYSESLVVLYMFWSSVLLNLPRSQRIPVINIILALICPCI